MDVVENWIGKAIMWVIDLILAIAFFPGKVFVAILELIYEGWKKLVLAKK